MANEDVLSTLQTALAAKNKSSTDGSGSFYIGQDASKLPSQVVDGAYYKGINVTTKSGYLSPRPGFIQTDFTLENENAYFTDNNGRKIRYKEVFEKGKFQGAYHYRTEAGERIVCVYSGLIFMLNPNTGKAQYLEIDKEDNVYSKLGNKYEPRTQRLNQYIDRHNFSQAGTYLVIFDYPDRPVILDGYHAFRSPTGETDTNGNPVYYVPPTVMGCYNSNRLFVADASNSFTAGDPVGSLIAPKAPITFNELYQESGEYQGQTFSLGSINKNNPITAMGFMQVTDTSTGIGPMFVATKDAIYMYATNTPRANWTTGDQAFGTMFLYNAGIIGPKAVENLNSDLIFMSGDGHVRSVVLSREYAASWENTPMDLEVWNWLKTDFMDIKKLTVIKSAYNKVFVTARPFITKSINLWGDYVYDYAFHGLVVLELDSTSSLQSKSNPAWAGIWTGLNVQDIVECDGDMYIFSKDPSYRNGIYKIDIDTPYDIYKGEKKNIKSRIYTKQYNGDSAFQDKRERSLLLGLQGLKGNIILDVERSNDYNKYSLWKHWEYNAPICSMDTPENLMEHNFRELSLGGPEETICSDVTGDYGDVYKGTQFRIDISGEYWRLEHLVIISDKVSSNFDTNLCELESGKKVFKDCEDIEDLYIYSTADYVEEI